MTKAWLGLVVLAGLSMPVSASAADNTVVGVGTGAVAGALVGGPIGAVVGAVAGGVIGSNSGRVRYRSHRRARAAHRRRYSDGAVPVHPRLADRGAVRPASAGETVAPAHRPASEISTAPEAATTGSTQGGWKDPK